MAKALVSSKCECSKPSLRVLVKALQCIKLDVMPVLFDQGFCSGATFLTGVLVARVCSKDEYALYVLGFTVLVIVQMINRNLVSIPFVVRSPHIKGIEHAHYFGSKIIHQLAVSAIVAAGLASAAVVLWMTQMRGHTAQITLALAVASVGLMARDFVRHIFLAGLQVWRNLAIGMVGNLATIAALYWTYSSGRLSGAVAYTILGVCSGLPALLVILLRLNQWRIVSSQVVRDLRDDWHFGRWLLVAVGATSLGSHSTPWLLLLLSGRESVATIGVLIAITSLIRPVIAGVDVYLLPKLANRLKQGGLQSAMKASAAVFAAMAGAMLVYVLLIAVWGDRIVGLLYSAQYRGHTASLVIIGVAMALFGMNSPLRALLKVMNHPQTECLSSVCGSIIRVIASISLIPSCGILGASIAVSIGNLISVGVNRGAISHWSRDA